MRNTLTRPLTLIVLCVAAPALARGEEPATVRPNTSDPQTVLQQLQPLLRKADARLHAEALDRCCRLGELEYLLETTSHELQQHTRVLDAVRHEPGPDAFRDAVELEQTASQLKEHHTQLRNEYDRLQQQHAAELLADCRQNGPRPASRTVQALLQLLRQRQQLTAEAETPQPQSATAAPAARPQAETEAVPERGVIEAQQRANHSTPLIRLLESRKKCR